MDSVVFFLYIFDIFSLFEPQYIYTLKMLCENYSVMQSDGSSFCENVVLDSLNITSRDEDSISDYIHIFEKKKLHMLL